MKTKSPAQLLYEQTGNRTPWADIGVYTRWKWHAIALKADAQAVRRATEREEVK